VVTQRFDAVPSLPHDAIRSSSKGSAHPREHGSDAVSLLIPAWRSRRRDFEAPTRACVFRLRVFSHEENPGSTSHHLKSA